MNQEPTPSRANGSIRGFERPTIRQLHDYQRATKPLFDLLGRIMDNLKFSVHIDPTGERPPEIFYEWTAEALKAKEQIEEAVVCIYKKCFGHDRTSQA